MFLYADCNDQLLIMNKKSLLANPEYFHKF